MDEILQTSKGSDARYRALCSFAQKHVATQKFDEYPRATKRSLAEDLARVVEQSVSKDVVPARELSATLNVLRLLSREDVEMESMHNKNAISWTMRLGGLVESETLDPSKLSSAENRLVVEEARKCCVNIISKAESLTEEFVRLGGHHVSLKILEETLVSLQQANGITSDTTEEEIEKSGKKLNDFNDVHESTLVPICRLIFTATRPIESNRPAIVSMREKGLANTASEYLFIYSYVMQDNKMLAAKLHVQDLLRILINLTLELGALGANDLTTLASIIPRFPRLIHAAFRIFQVKPDRIPPVQNAPRDPVYNLHLITTSCLVNVPSEVAPALFLNEDGGVPDTEHLIARMTLSCKVLFDVLEYTMDAQIAEQESPRAFVPMLMWITTLANGSKAVRPIMLKLLFPHRDIDNEEPMEGQNVVNLPGADVACLGNRIIKYMTAIETAVKHGATDLMHTLVDEDPERLVRLTGFGNAAGFLVQKNLMGMGGLASAASTKREDIEALSGKPLPRRGESSSSESKPASQPPASGAGASSARIEVEEDEEEEERKARELMMRLEDMERRGMVKLVRKGEPMPEGFSMPPQDPKDEEKNK